MKKLKKSKSRISHLTSLFIVSIVIFLGISYYFVYVYSSGPLSFLAKTSLIASVDGGMDTLTGNSEGANTGVIEKKGDAKGEAIKKAKAREKENDIIRSSRAIAAAEKAAIDGDDKKAIKLLAESKAIINVSITTNAPDETSAQFKEKCKAGIGTLSDDGKKCTYPKGTSAITTTFTSASCQGANSGIAGGAWAQTGGGIKELDSTSDMMVNKPDSLGCVQCGGIRKDGKAGPGVWGDSVQQCGEGVAKDYITRPDEVCLQNKTPEKNGCTQGAKGACWANGTWFSDSTGVNGDKRCGDGNWLSAVRDGAAGKSAYDTYKEGVCGGPEKYDITSGHCKVINVDVINQFDAMYKDAQERAKILLEQDKRKAQEAEAAKLEIERVTHLYPNNKCSDGKYKMKSSEICKPIQDTDKYGVVPKDSNITSISYNTGASAGRPTSFIGNISDTTYTNEFECETAVRAGEKCKHISGASSGTGSGMGYKIVIDQPYIKITFGTPAPAQPADQSPITPNTNEGTIYAPSTGTFGKTAQQQCEATKTIGYECQPAGFKDGAVTYKLVKTDVAEQVDTNPLSAEQQKQQITSNQIGLGAVGCIVGAGLFAIATGGFGLSALGLCATGLLAGSVIGSRLSVSNNSSVPTSQYSQSDLNNVVKDTGMNSLKVNILTDDPGKCKNGGGEVSGFYGGSAAIGYRLYQCN